MDKLFGNLASLIRFAAVSACVLVALGFMLFAIDESRTGSEGQVSKAHTAITYATPTAAQESVRERNHGAVREAIDDANDVLLKPFAGLVDDKGAWVRRVVPGAIALLLYGFGGLLLANFLPKPHREIHDWRDVPTS